MSSWAACVHERFLVPIVLSLEPGHVLAPEDLLRAKDVVSPAGQAQIPDR
jgi:hypothetical protein